VKFELIARGQDLQDLQAQIAAANDEQFLAVHGVLPEMREGLRCS
jgi:hypothetical protein